MSDMSFVITTNLELLKREIEQMKRGGSLKTPRPHKLLMLLAVINLADKGLLQDNKIYFNEELTSNFEHYFRTYGESDDLCQPAPPFFHLRNSTFWNLKVKIGCEISYAKLTTSGGGTKRIHDNIEYAYLSEEAYLVFTHIDAREELRTHIKALLSDKQRLKTVFHESFSLSRESLRQVISVFANKEKDSDLNNLLKGRKLLSAGTHLGENYIKAMPRYAVGAGLLNEDHSLTPFGQMVLQKDNLLDNINTLWLMHYFLSASQGPGPAFWHDLVTSCFVVNNEFKVSNIKERIANGFKSRESKLLAQRSVRSTANIFLRTYIKEEGLSKLGLLKEIVPDTYRVLEPDPPSPWAFGYALLHYWHTNFGDRLTINLDTLYGQGGLSTLFLCGAGRLNRMLSSLQMEGYVDVYRVAPPYQVVLLRQDANSLLQKLYGDYELT